MLQCEVVFAVLIPVVVCCEVGATYFYVAYQRLRSDVLEEEDNLFACDRLPLVHSLRDAERRQHKWLRFIRSFRGTYSVTWQTSAGT